MSTRGVIARTGKTEGEFSGVYHHFDSQPTSLGATLLELHRGFFKGDLDRMLQVLIEEHNGWNTIVGKDFRLKPGYSGDYKKLNPACYCHGKRSEKNPPITHEDMDDTDICWVYAFDTENNKMFVRDIRHKEDAGIFDLSDRLPTKKELYVIECAEDFHRCSHYAWVHGLTPKTSNLSTQTWLGNRPLEMNDAIGFIVNGKRLAATGSGGKSDYYNNSRNRIHMGLGHMKPFPSGAWIASVKARNGRRSDVPVALIEDNGYKPFPSVVWIMPPTKDNPTETFIGGVS
jgi:hypothetical protein